MPMLDSLLNEESELQSPYPPESALQKLSAGLSPTPHGGLLHGGITGNRFGFQPNSRNFLSPLICGEVLPADTGSIIRYSVRIPRAKMLVFGLFYIYAFVGLRLLYYAFNGTYISPALYIVGIVMLGIRLFEYIFERLRASAHAEALSAGKLLEELLGRSVSQ
jgi:hypothetical protein